MSENFLLGYKKKGPQKSPRSPRKQSFYSKYKDSLKHSNPQSPRSPRKQSLYLEDNSSLKNSNPQSFYLKPKSSLKNSNTQSPRTIKNVSISVNSTIRIIPNNSQMVEGIFEVKQPSDDITVPTDGESSNKGTYMNDGSKNTKQYFFGSYKIFNSKLTMTKREIERQKTFFRADSKIQEVGNSIIEVGKSLVYDFYYPLIIIKEWWNTEFAPKGNIYKIRDIDEIKILPTDSEVSFDCNIKKKSKNDNIMFDVTIHVDLEKGMFNLKQRGSLEPGGSLESGGASKKLTRRRRINLKKRRRTKRI